MKRLLTIVALLVVFLSNTFSFNVMAEETQEVRTVKLDVLNEDGLVQFTSREEEKYKVLTGPENHEVGDEWVDVTIEIEPQQGYQFSSNPSVTIYGDTSGVKRVDKWRTGNNLKIEYEIRAIAGRLEAPYDVRWVKRNYGIARWEEPDESDTITGYKVSINGKTITVRDNEVDLINYLKKGNNSFKVKSISSIKGMDDSEYVESDNELYSSYDRRNNNSSSGNNYYGPTTSGILKNQWIQDNGQWYYLDGNGNKYRNCFATINGPTYYFNADGVMLTGWQKINEVYYYFDSSGAMYTSPRTVQGVYGHTYYFNANGTMKYGWQKNSKGYYYVDSTGNPLMNGEFKIDGYYYRFTPDGFLYLGWWQDPSTGYWYYYNEGPGTPVGFPDGSKAFDTYIRARNNGAIYYVDATGKWIQ